MTGSPVKIGFTGILKYEFDQNMYPGVIKSEKINGFNIKTGK